MIDYQQQVTQVILDPHALNAFLILLFALGVLVIDARIRDVFGKSWLGKWKKDR